MPVDRSNTLLASSSPLSRLARITLPFRANSGGRVNLTERVVTTINVVLELKLDTIQSVPVECLRLDRRNPRLVGRTEHSSDAKIIAWLYVSTDLDELLLSISTNGYMDIEPLVVLRQAGTSDLLVLEGNRRLAALRLLSQPELIRDIKETESVNIKVPNVSQSIRRSLERLSVYPVASRESARSFIGFKHMNGPAKWSAYAKARYAADWYRQQGGKDLKSIAASIGDGHSTIKRMVSAIYVLDQARENNVFNIEERFTVRFNFSHLYSALSRPQYMQYLKISSVWAQCDPQPDPVAYEEFPKLKKLLVWIYGSKEENRKPVVGFQNPDIKRLGEVLTHSEGLHVLETTSDLDLAHAVTESINRRFTLSLVRAREDIKDAFSSIRAFDGRDFSLLHIAADVKEMSDTVYHRMHRKSFNARIEQDG